ncbi:MAG: AIM24 family protein, partial [Tunicatimonas sp.]
MKRSHEIDYQILGDGIQVVEVELDPSETVIAEAGAMVYLEDGIDFETKM